MPLLGFAARSFIFLYFDTTHQRPVRHSGERAFEKVTFDGKFKDDVHPVVLELACERLPPRVIDEIKCTHRLGLVIHNFIRRNGHGVRFTRGHDYVVNNLLIVADPGNFSLFTQIDSPDQSPTSLETSLPCAPSGFSSWATVGYTAKNPHKMKHQNSTPIRFIIVPPTFRTEWDLQRRSFRKVRRSLTFAATGARLRW